MELMQELETKLTELSVSIRELRKNGQAFAQAEHNYKVAMTVEILKMKDEKVPATLISLIIYGKPEIARLRLQRDIAEVMYNANQEHINVMKLQIRIIENQIQREYNDRG